MLNFFFQNGCFVNLDNFSDLYQISWFMRKPALCIFFGLCILTSFSLLTINVRGVSNKHCLLPFFHFILLIFLSSSGSFVYFQRKKLSSRQIKGTTVDLFKRFLNSLV